MLCVHSQPSKLCLALLPASVRRWLHRPLSITLQCLQHCTVCKVHRLSGLEQGVQPCLLLRLANIAQGNAPHCLIRLCTVAGKRNKDAIVMDAPIWYHTPKLILWCVFEALDLFLAIWVTREPPDYHILNIQNGVCMRSGGNSNVLRSIFALMRGCHCMNKAIVCLGHGSTPSVLSLSLLFASPLGFKCLQGMLH